MFVVRRCLFVCFPGVTTHCVRIFTALYRALASSFSRFLDHTQRRATVGRTPLDDWSIRRRDLYLTKRHSQQTDIHAPGGIRTHNLSSGTAVDLRLRPRGYWDRQLILVTFTFSLHRTAALVLYSFSLMLITGVPAMCNLLQLISSSLNRSKSLWY